MVAGLMRYFGYSYEDAVLLPYRRARALIRAVVKYG